MTQSLEQLLKSQYANPVESTGEFTMDAEKVLKKMAEYQLPNQDAWVVKMGQGAVLSGAEKLRIHQTSTDTSFIFTPKAMLKIDLITSFFDPSPNPIEWWQLFRSSLWAVGIGLRRPFKIGFFGRYFYWDGFKLHPLEIKLLPCGPSREITLELSHRTAEQGKGLPVLRGIQAARMNARLCKYIGRVLFSCPLRVFLDGLLIDGFQRAPDRGFTSLDHPVRMFWVEGEPGLGIPPTTRWSVGHSLGAEELSGLSQLFKSEPPSVPVKAAAIISAHADRKPGNKSGWKVASRKSFVYWIRHGVVVLEEDLNFPKLCVSIAVFANCDHIDTDMTGFGLERQAKARTLAKICRSIDESFDVSEMDLVLHNRERHRTRYEMAGGLAASGLALKFVFPPALLLTGVGFVGAIWLSRTVASIDLRINKDLQRLKSEWSKLNWALR